jgi:F-type H+-transporting ATPase subunit b
LKSEAETTLSGYQKAIADARAAAQAEHNRAVAAIAAETEKREAEFSKRLDEKTSAAEQRIAGAKTEALHSVRSIAVDLSQMMTQKLVGAGVSGDTAMAAVDAAIKGRG